MIGKVEFISTQKTFSPYYVKGIVPDLGREYKDDIVPPSGSLQTSRKDETYM